MSDQFQQKIMEYIDSIAHGLGVASQFVFETLVRQKIIEGWVYLSTVVAIVAIGLGVSIYMWSSIRNDMKKYDTDFDDHITTLSIMAIILFVVVLIGSMGIPYNVMKICNPQYYALKDILDVVKGN